MNVAHLNNAMWMAQPALETGIAVVMFRRKLHKKFPRFFAYVLTQIVMFCILFPLLKGDLYTLYFYVYWITQLISLAIGMHNQNAQVYLQEWQKLRTFTWQLSWRVPF